MYIRQAVAAFLLKETYPTPESHDAYMLVPDYLCSLRLATNYWLFTSCAAVKLAAEDKLQALF